MKWSASTARIDCVTQSLDTRTILVLQGLLLMLSNLVAELDELSRELAKSMGMPKV